MRGAVAGHDFASFCLEKAEVGGNRGFMLDHLIVSFNFPKKTWNGSL